MAAVLRQRGLIYTLGLALNRAIPCWLLRGRWFRIFEREVAGDVGSVQSDRVRWATAQDLAHLHQIANSLGPPTCDDRLCVYVIDDELVGCLGISAHRNTDVEIGSQFLIPPSSRWLFQGVVNQAHRGQGIFGCMVAFVSQHCYQDAVRSQLFAITRFNRASERSNQDATVIGGGCCVRVFNVALGLAWGRRLKLRRAFTSNARKCPLKFGILPRPDSVSPPV